MKRLSYSSQLNPLMHRPCAREPRQPPGTSPSRLLARNKAISDGVSIRGAGEGPSLRMSAAVEGVIEAPFLPSREAGSVLSFDFMVMSLFPWALRSPVVWVDEWRNPNLGDRVGIRTSGVGVLHAICAGAAGTSCRMWTKLVRIRWAAL